MLMVVIRRIVMKGAFRIKYSWAYKRQYAFAEVCLVVLNDINMFLKVK